MKISLQHSPETFEFLPSLTYARLFNHRFIYLSFGTYSIELHWVKPVSEEDAGE